MNSPLGVVTIGQAPRSDVGPILEKYLGNQVKMIQVGALDGLTKAEIDDTLFPETGDYVLTSRLLTAESVVMSREKLQPLLQKRIDELESQGCKQILVLCTGVFHGLQTKSAFLIEPDQIIPSAVSGMVKNRQLGVITPLDEQRDTMAEKWEAFGLSPLVSTASPYRSDEQSFQKAAQSLVEQGADVILLDCMGYVEEMRDLIRRQSDVPVILSNSLMAKLVSEMI